MNGVCGMLRMKRRELVEVEMLILEHGYSEDLASSRCVE